MTVWKLRVTGQLAPAQHPQPALLGPYAELTWLEISWPNRTAILTFSTSALSPSLS